MNLSTLLENIPTLSITGKMDLTIDNLSQDTRENYTSQTLYFAVPGTQVDGHEYISNAVEKGAIAIVCERLPKSPHENSTYIIVSSVVDSMGHIVANFYSNPSKKIKIIAITGTNGKTTVATSLYQSLLRLGQKAALFSTAGDYINNDEFHAHRLAGTSMEIIEFNKNIQKAVDAGCEYLCIEATSHALDQNRLNAVSLAGAVFTNLTQDHLDYHETMEKYAAAKKKLFDALTPEAFAVINIDDSYGAFVASETKAKIISYGDRDFDTTIARDVIFNITGFGMQGTEILLNENPAHVSCVGVFNIYNITATYAVLLELGFNPSEVTSAFAGIQGAKGRMQIVSGEKQGVIGIVDYAHTPDALKNVLETLQELPHKRIITVVGVGGDRDRTKRPQMAKIAQNNSDYVFYTSDNPRTENPEQIFADLLAGCDNTHPNFERVQDREDSIRKAVESASSGDIILVAGKGHEDYQIIGTEKTHFDDVEVLKKYLK